MEFPIEMQILINDYARPCIPGSEAARPITRPDWRKGSYIVRTLKADIPADFHEWLPPDIAYWNRDLIIEHLKILINEFGGDM